MALVKTTASAVDLGGQEAQKFKIDTESTDHIISILTHAYAKPQFSSLREVIQNAIDACPSGKKVQVTMPTEANPMLVIRDHGKGMDRSAFEEMIGSVGASDKRGDKTKAGCLGIGSLAPMSIAESMTMTSYKGGQMVSFHAYKDDAGNLGYTITGPNKAPKNECDGMQVTVPIPHDMFEAFREGLSVFKFSPAICEKLIVDGEQLEPNHIILGDKVKVGAHEVEFVVMEGTTEVLAGALVLLNNLPMAASFERFPDLKNFESYLKLRESSSSRRNPYASTTMVIKVPPEAGLSFPPSREVVAATRLNAAFLTNAVQRYFDQGTKALMDKGLHLGCEAAVAMRWQAIAVGEKKTLREVQKKLQEELDKTSEYLRVDLHVMNDYRRGEVPSVTLHPRLPATLCPRSLETKQIRMRRTGNHQWQMQTCGCIPVSLDDEARGFKHPWDTSTPFKLVTWDKLETEYENDWARVAGRNRLAKQALFDLGVKWNSKQSWRVGYEQDGNVLLAAHALEPDHPLFAIATHIKFEDYLASYTPSEQNPFKKSDDEGEDEDVLADGTVVSKGEKERHPRDFATASGFSDRLGLPADKPFMYLEVLRDKYTLRNQQRTDDHPGCRTSSWSTWNINEEWCHAIKFFEDSGVGDDLVAVQLRPAEVKNIKRPHVRLLDGLSLLMRAWLDELEPEDRLWIPFGMFRAEMDIAVPRLAKMFEVLHDTPDCDAPALKWFLKGWDDAPSQTAERFVNAYKRQRKAGQAIADEFHWHMDPDEQRDRSFEKLTGDMHCFGFPSAELSRPARFLKAWIRSRTPLSQFLRLMFKLSAQDGARMTLSLAPWMTFSATHGGGFMDDGMTRPIALAKRLIDTARAAP
jgi:hypothetical protein